MKRTKILILLSLLLLNGIVSQAQTKKVYVVFETTDYAAMNYVNGKYVWRPEVPYKQRVRIIIAPFDVPQQMNEPMKQEIGNQIASFVYKEHLKLFEKLRGHNTSFNWGLRNYDEQSYNYNVNDYKNDPQWIEHERTVITGFSFVPKESKAFSADFMKMVEYISGNKKAGMGRTN